MIRILIVVAVTLGLVLVGTSCASSPTSDSHGAAHWSWLGDTDTATQGGQVWGMSCASTRLCVAVGAYNPDSADGHQGKSVTIFHGSKWSTNTVIGQKWSGCINHHLCPLQGYGLDVIACAPNRFCMTTDTVSRSFMYDGTKWSEAPLHFGLPPSIFQGTGTSMSCPSQTFCMAVNNIDIADTFDGSRWGEARRAFVGNAAPGRVWCRNAHFCIAFGLDTMYTYNGSSWSKVGVDGGAELPQSWSCLLHTDCQFSNGYTVPFVEGFGSAGASVSCVTKTFCMAVSGTSYFTYDGSHWSRSGSLPHAHVSDLYPEEAQSLQPQLSCIPSNFCLLVAPDGQTWVWR